MQVVRREKVPHVLGNALFFGGRSKDSGLNIESGSTLGDGTVNLREISGKTRDSHDVEWRYSGVFVLGPTPMRGRIVLS